ncbi:glucose dehydrogenase [FAD, quinone]-like [Uranotaenia lowii]|uniref:glucose dehydrogenase [FAD, quinone]-like n=1 Tax=Uranotaenia lowii TaxID=190385 RepID=UPI002479EDF4|nr:glucose dehydrogenase [FAD, quinone]-like [Uranotaenia lowii]
MYGEMMKTKYDWNFRGERSATASFAVVNGTTYWPAGKVLGGSSAYASAYIRGNRRDFDGWEQEGNSGWGWNDVLPYFIKSENNKVREVREAYGGRYHGSDGPVTIDHYHVDSPFERLLVRIFEEAGERRLIDVNAEEHIGFVNYQNTLNGATRCSSAKAFLSSVKERKNLHVIKNAFVRSIIFDDNNMVTGVEMILQDKFLIKAFAKREVILSAGAINTPKLLMRSGIGPRKVLEPLEIPIRAELNVGQNLQEHAMVPMFFDLGARRSNVTELDVLRNLYVYTVHNRDQPVIETDGAFVFDFVNVKNESNEFPDMQYIYYLLTNQTTDSLKLLKTMNYNEKFIESLEKRLEQNDLLAVFNVALNPKSRGQIQIVSNNAREDPKIFGGLLTNPNDIRDFELSIRNRQQLFRTPLAVSSGIELIKLDLPRCDQQLEYDSDEYWTCYCRHMSVPIWHPVGTTKMGPASDAEAVVSSELKVHGVEGLRVVDNSIIPKMPSGNTLAVAMMIGEKGADLIKLSYE